MTYTPPPRDPTAAPVRINLLSDTQTRPTSGMREAIARAEVGDEQIGDDPTVNFLCERVADLLGKQAAVFMPSGTMCNVAATLCIAGPATKFSRMRPRTSSRAKAAPMPPSAVSRSRRCPALTANFRPIPFVRRFTRAAATSRRRRWSVSNKPPISAGHDLEEARAR